MSILAFNKIKGSNFFHGQQALYKFLIGTESGHGGITDCRYKHATL